MKFRYFRGSRFTLIKKLRFDLWGDARYNSRKLRGLRAIFRRPGYRLMPTRDSSLFSNFDGVLGRGTSSLHILNSYNKNLINWLKFSNRSLYDSRFISHFSERLIVNRIKNFYSYHNRYLYNVSKRSKPNLARLYLDDTGLYNDRILPPYYLGLLPVIRNSFRVGYHNNRIHNIRRDLVLLGKVKRNINKNTDSSKSSSRKHILINNFLSLYSPRLIIFRKELIDSFYGFSFNSLVELNFMRRCLNFLSRRSPGWAFDFSRESFRSFKRRFFDFLVYRDPIKGKLLFTIPEYLKALNNYFYSTDKIPLRRNYNPSSNLLRSLPSSLYRYTVYRPILVYSGSNSKYYQYFVEDFRKSYLKYSMDSSYVRVLEKYRKRKLLGRHMIPISKDLTNIITRLSTIYNSTNYKISKYKEGCLRNNTRANILLKNIKLHFVSLYLFYGRLLSILLREDNRSLVIHNYESDLKRLFFSFLGKISSFFCHLDRKFYLSFKRKYLKLRGRYNKYLCRYYSKKKRVSKRLKSKFIKKKQIFSSPSQIYKVDINDPQFKEKVNLKINKLSKRLSGEKLQSRIRDYVKALKQRIIRKRKRKLYQRQKALRKLRIPDFTGWWGVKRLRGYKRRFGRNLQQKLVRIGLNKLFRAISRRQNRAVVRFRIYRRRSRFSRFGYYLRVKQFFQMFYNIRTDYALRSLFLFYKNQHIDYFFRFIRSLESRLYMTLYRSGFFSTPKVAARFIKDGYISVNGTVCINSFYLLRPGDLITFKVSPLQGRSIILLRDRRLIPPENLVVNYRLPAIIFSSEISDLSLYHIWDRFTSDLFSNFYKL